MKKNKFYTRNKLLAKKNIHILNKLFYITAFTLSLCLLFLLLFYWFFTFSIKSTFSDVETNVISVLNEVKNTNNRSTELMTGNTINIDISKVNVPIILDELTNQKKEILSISYPEKYNELFQNIKSGLDSNIRMYLIISDAIFEGSLNEESLENLSINTESAIAYYKKIQINSFLFELSPSSINYSNAVVTHYKDILSSKDKSVVSEEKNYFNSLNNISYSFNSIFENLSTNVTASSSGYENFESTNASVISKNSEITKLLEELDALVVPNNVENHSSSLKDSINKYVGYLNSFLTDASNHFSNNSSKVDGFKTSTSSYNAIEKEYNKFKINLNKKFLSLD